MRNARVWQRVLGLARTVIEGVVVEDDGDAIVVAVRPRKGSQRRCGRCGRRSPWYDRGEGRRRWRSLDLGTQRVWLEADAPRVKCRTHGPTVIQVPWARHDAGHTRDFDATVAWLAVQCSKTATSELMRVAWRTVGSIITRVQADIDATVDRFAGLRRIGIDEISYKRGHRYLTVVVDHDTGRLVWAAVGRDETTLRTFFDLLGEDRSRQITHVSADAADRLHRAYLLKEGLRLVFVLKGDAGKEALDRWLSWAQRCHIPAFVELRRKIIRHRAAIDATLEHGLSNALIESTNTKIRLLTRIAFGFKNVQALIALAMLALGGHRPALPGRN